MPQGPFLRKYGVETTINFTLFEVDGVDFRVDAADGGTDCSVMKDEGDEATCTNDFADEGNGYSLVLAAAEMQAARIVVYVVDQTATKVWLDDSIVIETYGHASAMHAMDFDDGVRGGMTALPNAAANAAGGLPISAGGSLALDTQLAATNEVTAARMGALTDLIDGGRLDLLLDAIPTTAMRGTDSAALASVCTEGRLAELDAANLPTDIAAIPTTAMRGTDNAALASVCTEARLAELAAANLPTDIDAILADTNELQTDDYPTSIAAIKAETALIVADTNELQTDNVPGLIAALNDLSAANVNAEVVDALATDTYAEPGQATPPATATLAVKLAYLYKAWRNRKTTTALLESLYGDDAATVHQKSTLSDDTTTFDKGEVATGP